MSVSIGGASEVDGTATAASEVGGTESGGGADDDDDPRNVFKPGLH